MSTTSLKLDTTQLKHLAGLLMGMAYADGDYDGDEAMTIGTILRELIPGQELPSEVTSYLARFDIATLNIPDSCQALLPLNKAERGQLLGLISRVADADGVHDLEETAYIQAVGEALGASPGEYERWTIELIFPEPPPLP